MVVPPEVETGFALRVLTIEAANGLAGLLPASDQVLPTTFGLRIVPTTRAMLVRMSFVEPRRCDLLLE
ncbi:MAG: hypothetical protein EXS09_14400 [Gemmataceae bacterium]|nr:hypothetical protein [Gemmataceae bacterium]